MFVTGLFLFVMMNQCLTKQDSPGELLEEDICQYANLQHYITALC